jgi:hypothetical protein
MVVVVVVKTPLVVAVVETLLVIVAVEILVTLVTFKPAVVSENVLLASTLNKMYTIISPKEQIQKASNPQIVIIKISLFPHCKLFWFFCSSFVTIPSFAEFELTRICVIAISLLNITFSLILRC